MPNVVWGGNNQSGTSFVLSGDATYLPGQPANGSFVPSDFLLQNGPISQVKIYIAATGSFTLKLFRPNATTPTNYDLLGSSAPLTASATGLQTFSPSGLPDCQPGDMLGIYLPPAGAQVYGTSLTGTTIRAFSGNATGTNIAFPSSQPGVINLQVLGPAPFVVIAGDSISVGSSNDAPLNFAGYFDYDGNVLTSGPVGNLAHCPGAALLALNSSYTYQDLGKYGAWWLYVSDKELNGDLIHSTGQVSIVGAQPTALIIHCGINDARNGSFTWDNDVLPALTAIQGTLQPGQHLFIDEILPIYPDGMVPTAATFNANFATWCAANNATLISMAAAFTDTNGQLAAPYRDSGGIHLSQAGVNLMASLWLAALNNFYNIPFTGPSSGGARAGGHADLVVTYPCASAGGARAGGHAGGIGQVARQGQGGARAGGRADVAILYPVKASGGGRSGGSVAVGAAFSEEAHGGGRAGGTVGLATPAGGRYFAPSYFSQRYWGLNQPVGQPPPSGPNTYWAPSYFSLRYWGQNRPAKPTGQLPGSYFARRFWTRKYWPYFGGPPVGGTGPTTYWAPRYFSWHYWGQFEPATSGSSVSPAALWTLRARTFLPWTFRPLYAKGGQAAFLLPTSGGARAGGTATVSFVPAPNVRVASGGARAGGTATVSVTYPVGFRLASGGARAGGVADVRSVIPQIRTATGGARAGSQADVTLTYPVGGRPAMGGARAGGKADVTVQYPFPFFGIEAQGGARAGGAATVFSSIPQVLLASGGARAGGTALVVVVLPEGRQGTGGGRAGGMGTVEVHYPGLTEFVDGQWTEIDTQRGLTFWEPSRSILWTEVDTDRGITWEEFMESLVKRSGELRTYAWEFKDYAELLNGDTLNGSVAVTADMPGLALGTPQAVGTQVLCIVSGGTPNTVYTLTATVSTGGGSVIQLPGQLVVRDD